MHGEEVGGDEDEEDGEEGDNGCLVDMIHYGAVRSHFDDRRRDSGDCKAQLLNLRKLELREHREVVVIGAYGTWSFHGACRTPEF